MALTGEVRAGLVTAGVALAVGALTLNWSLAGVFYDDGIYASLAIALARGAGYVHLNLPGAPAAVHYPPLYPLLLAPLFAFLPVEAAVFAAKVLNLLLAAAAAGLIAWHAGRCALLGDRLPWWLTSVVVAAAAVAIPLLTLQAVLFSEPLFVALLAATVAVADRPPSWLRPGAAAAVAGGVASLSVLTRSIGIAVCAGVLLFAIAVRRDPWQRVVALATPVAATALAWGLWVAAHRAGIDPALALGYGTYGDHLSQAGWSAVTANLVDLPRPLGALVLGWLPMRVASILIGLAALVIGIYGLGLLSRRSSAGVVLLCYLAILVVWPYFPDRFVWAVLPWLAVAWVAGAVSLWRRAPLRVPVAVVAASVGIGYCTYEARGFAHHSWQTAARAISANFEELLPAVRRLPEDAVVATDDEALVWLYTGRRAVPLYLYSYRGREIVEPSVEAQRAYLERQGATHVLLASPRGDTARQLRALMHAYPHWISGLYSWPDGRGLFAVAR